MNHIMVDIETTGLNPYKHAIIQIAAVKFEPRGGHPTDGFEKCLHRLITRVWDADTYKWWTKDKLETLRLIESRAVDGYNAMRAFKNWVGEDPVFWAKPSLFDFPFIESYFEEVGIESPFNFRQVNDVRSYCLGLLGHEVDFSAFQKQVPFIGTPHIAMDDCLHQIDIVQHAHATAKGIEQVGRMIGA